MDIVMTALSTDRVKCLPFVIQDKIAIEIWLNHYEDTRKKISNVLKEHTELLSHRFILSRKISLLNEKTFELDAEMRNDPNFNVDERTRVLSRLTAKITSINAEYDRAFRGMGSLMIERGILNREAREIRQQIITIATRLGELDFTTNRIESIHIREFSEGL